MSYRGFKMPWHGTPKDWDPSLLIEQTRLQRKRFTKVFISWNGATDINAWAVFAGDDEESMESVGVAKNQGFETVFHLEDAMCVQLGAVRDGKIIRASNLVCLDPDDVYHDATGVLDEHPAEPSMLADLYDGTTGTLDDQPAEPSSPADVLQGEIKQPEVEDVGDYKHEELSSAVDELQAQKEQLEAEKADLTAAKADLTAEKADLKVETAKLQAQMDDLEMELEDIESGAWFSYRLFAEVACGVVAIVAVTWAYILWRERRRTNFQEDRYEPSGFGLGSFGLGNKTTRTPEIRIQHASTSSVDEAQMRMRDQEAFDLIEDDDDEDDVSAAGSVTPRTPFLRQTTGV